jgi:thioredoxin-like negative regulator of GroEL
VEEIRSLTENGSPSSLLSSLELIRSRELASTEFGRVMIACNVTLIKAIYPGLQAQLPPQDPPQTHIYARILRDAEKGLYTPPPAGSRDYLEYTLPFLAFYSGEGKRNASGERLLSALPDLEKAAELNGTSVLAPYFTGIVFERSGRSGEALAQYTRAWQLSAECYPAALALARVFDSLGQKEESLKLLQDLVIRFPDNFPIKRQMAMAWYNNRDWSRAEPAITEILQRDPRDGEFILMRARVLVEQGQYLQAQAPLNLYASINPANPLYLFLRARVQAEGYHNRDAALTYLRSLLRGSPDDEASVYAVRLFLESPRPEEQSEGRELLRRLLSSPNPSLMVVSMALQDAVRREAWREAQPYLRRLLEERRSAQDLFYAYTVEHGQGNNAAALSYAREFYEKDPSNEEGAIAYISALIDTGRQSEAGGMIESRLSALAGGAFKSRYFYLRSRIHTNEDAVMNDLRSSLFEDPRNLDALIAMFEIYHRRRDERRAVYYLKQALSLAPNNPQLKRYEAEYANKLGGAY